MRNVSLVRVWLDPGTLSPGVRLYVEGPCQAGVRALIHRLPVSAGPVRGRPPVDEHLAAGPGESPWRPVADVLVADAIRPPTGEHLAAGPGESPWRPVADAIRPPSGALVTALVLPGGGGVVSTATGWRALFVPLGAGRLLPCASFVHAWLVAGRSLAGLDRASIVDERGRGFRIEVTSEPRRRSRGVA